MKKNYSYIQGWVSIVVNTLLFVLKYIAGISSGSIALIADAWHTLSDSISSVILLMGTKLSGKPADEDHPYGHGRAELATGIVIGVLLGVVGASFIKEAIEEYLNGGGAKFDSYAIWVTILSVVLKEGLAQFALWGSRKTNSHSLKADGWHHRSDAISSLVILAGIFLQDTFWFIDSLLGLFVGIFILYTAYELLREAIDQFLGKNIDSALEKNLDEICEDVSDIEVNPHDFQLHDYGDHKELTFHIKLPNDMKLEEAHHLADNIEEEIEKKLNIRTTIHMEPIYDPKKQQL